MNELEWAKSVHDYVDKYFREHYPKLEIKQSVDLAYGYEILEYEEDKPAKSKPISYETDLLVVERINDTSWKPRVVIECKIDRVTTHDAITYSEKAFAHKRVHPYLRYGIILGNRKHYPLPGRLYRHGLYFDFMASWTSFTPSQQELNDLLEILIDEVNSSQNLEEMLFESRSPKRKQYVVLHRPLLLKTKR